MRRLMKSSHARRNSTPLLLQVSVLAVTCFFSHISHAEGSRTLFPVDATGSRGSIDAASGQNFLNLGPAIQFMYVYAQAGEKILLGSRARNNGGDIYIYNPQSFGAKGAETVPINADFACSSQGAGLGYIDSRSQELAGPNSANGINVVVGGYQPCFYTAPQSGIYGVKFTRATSGSGYNTSIANPTINGAYITAWDVTVRSDENSTVDLNGRLFTYAWSIDSDNLRNSLYYASEDGYRYRQTFQGMNTAQGLFFANSSGFLDTNGSPLYRDIRGSTGTVMSGPSMAAGVTPQRPQYPIFFSDISPDGANASEVSKVLTALAIPLEPATPILVNPSFVGNISGHTSAVSSGGTFKFTTENTLTYEIVISQDATDFDPANPLNRVLTGIALTGNHSVLWDGLDNNGNPFPVGSYDFRITGRNGEIHFPMVDIERNANGGPSLVKLNGPTAGDDTVYFDDRGYRTASGVEIGQLNGHLCGAASTNEQPNPNHSLVGISSSSAYRSWSVGANLNSDCGSGGFFGDAKALDLWSFEKTAPILSPIEIVPQPITVDVGTAVSATPSVLAGDTAYGQFSFYNASSSPANSVTYSVSIGDLATGTCPAAANFTLVPSGITASYSAATCAVSFTNMPNSLTGGQQLNFSFSYVVAPSNAGPIPVRTQISAGNEDNDVAPNTATAQTLVATPQVSVVKRAAPATNAQLSSGDTVTYSVAVTVANAPTTANFTFTDTPGAGLAFGSISSAHASFSCNSGLVCSLPAGTAVGTYTVSYTAVVQGSAGTSVTNQVQITGNGGDSDPVCVTCSVTHSVAKPAIALIKTGVVDKGADGILNAGDTINYHFSVTNTGNVPLTAITVAELTFSGTGAAPVISGGPIDLAVGATDSTTFTASYQITQKDIDAGGVSNQARAQGSSPNRSGDVSDLSDGSNPAGDQPTQTPLTSVPTAPQSVPVNAPWGIAMLMVCMLAFANRERLGKALKR